jgi:hypothetical protein
MHLNGGISIISNRLIESMFLFHMRKIREVLYKKL